MKFLFAGCVLSLFISTPLLAENRPMGPNQPDWPPPGGYAKPVSPAQTQPPAANAFPPGYMPPQNFRPPAYTREAPVLPPDADWPDTAYGYADMAPPPQPGYPVQVIPPPGIPLEGDIMNTTTRPVRHWRPQGHPR